MLCMCAGVARTHTQHIGTHPAENCRPEEKYHTTLVQLETVGLPDDADFEMHEDYVMWHHWHEVLEVVSRDIAAVEEIAGQGLYPRRLL